MDAGCGEALVDCSSDIRNRISNICLGIQAVVNDFHSIAAGARRGTLRDAESELKTLIPILKSAVDAASKAQLFMTAYKLQHELEQAEKCVRDLASFQTQPANSERPEPNQVYTPLRINRVEKRVALAPNSANPPAPSRLFQPTVNTPTNPRPRELNFHSSPETRKSFNNGVRFMSNQIEEEYKPASAFIHRPPRNYSLPFAAQLQLQTKLRMHVSFVSLSPPNYTTHCLA